eukprot:GHRR01027663.1.p1 GENE.GHRR01027663.1~~GHRR01027663.1.p1  ORF type:complete len:377 (+),score=114.07 GHRR01027663.1:121-1251(+)
MVWDAVEDHFGIPCQIFAEHTSIITWHAGASIGWHHDANRPYLSQRHYSAVVYLNTQDSDFTGGTFCFQAGRPPLCIQPVTGLLLLYKADEANVHMVEPVTVGHRCTFTLWFTLDQEYQEDRKVMKQLTSTAAGSGLPPTLYQLAPGGPDIRLALVRQMLGLELIVERVCLQCGRKLPRLQAEDSQLPESNPLVHKPIAMQARARHDTLHKQLMVYLPSEAARCHQCLTNSSDPCKALTADASSHNKPLMGADGLLGFHSVQDALMAFYMLDWKICGHSMSCRKLHIDASATGQLALLQPDSFEAGELSPMLAAQAYSSKCLQQEQLCTTVGCGCYGDRQCFQQAQSLVQQALQHGASELERLLPLWSACGALVFI